MSWLTNCHVDKTMGMIENFKLRGEIVYAEHTEIMLNCIKYYEEKIAADKDVIVAAREYIEQLKATISVLGERVSLRDQFACFAILGKPIHLHNTLAEEAYAVADAMLEARKK